MQGDGGLRAFFGVAKGVGFRHGGLGFWGLLDRGFRGFGVKWFLELGFRVVSFRVWGFAVWGGRVP